MKNVQRTNFKTLDNVFLQPFHHARLDSFLSKPIRYATWVKITSPTPPNFPPPRISDTPRALPPGAWRPYSKVSSRPCFVFRSLSPLR